MLTAVHHLIGAAEIGELFGVSRQRVQQLINRADFPKPTVTLAMGKVWETEDVLRWGREHNRIPSEDSEP